MVKKVNYTLVILLLSFSFQTANSQVVILRDSTHAESVKSEAPGDTTFIKKHSPKRAALFSAIIPGSGQIYNRKYWKPPLVWAGFGTIYYFAQQNNKNYLMFREAYVHAAINDGSEPPYPDLYEAYSVANLKRYKDLYRRNRDLMYILGGLWYLLNVIDATVDGHLYSWEVDEDLTLSLTPDFQFISESNRKYAALKLSLKF